MKKLQESNSENSNWENQLIEDLSFIKKHLRYPLRRMTLMPLISAGAISIYFFRTIVMVAFFQKNHHFNFIILLIVILMSLPVFMALRRYLDIIKFTPVATTLFLADNIKLLERFLKEQHFVVFKHPDAPEIFQIISKNISAIGDEREVLVFIADDKRILINSHFSYSRKRFRLLSAPTHHREIIKLLRNWIKQQPSQDTGLTKSSF